MNTDLKHLLAMSMPSFAYTRLERFEEHETRHQVVHRIHHKHANVDLAQVVGTEHPDYWGCSWLHLLGSPPGEQSAGLKRIYRGLSFMVNEPSYYTSNVEKEHWSFYLMGGRYFVSEGNHRTVIGRFLLSLNGLPTTVSGVSVTELVLK